MYKLIIAVRRDLKLPKGKLAVQVAHAAVDAVLKSERKLVEAWLHDAAKKVVVEVADVNELKALQAAAKQRGLRTALVKDAGRTVVVPGTVTCLGIGPEKEEKIEPVTGALRML